MKSFTVNGKTMRYQDVGTGEVLLFGHSYLWNSQMWQPQVAVLSRNYRCIVPDLWSHGQSDAAPDTMHSLKDYAGHMLALMDHLAIGSFSVIGLSVGGMWGSELALIAPERVKALVLMDTFIGLEPEVMHAKYFAMLDAAIATQSFPEPLIPQVVPMFFSEHALQQTPEPDFVTAFRMFLMETSGPQVAEMGRIGKLVFGRRDLIDEIGDLNLPVLIMVGEQDKPRPVLESHLMQDAIAGSQLIVIPQAGHISNLEQPEFVTQALQDFLGTLTR
ncbi:alpha/beta fold hydrolase [Vibrio sp. MEBiC08052]|uniref:alpha/beta fold hydrolase n=1 Tax=Vibrio sp. MEBiC08052 TaxID=1761910 RepID=UPI00074059BA|nr:alpha/beta fold hydrolase [Vibrio sp. MEBiC08052]KUI97845.1 beta-ketoadipate enol-lactone hydrolase [Vibrio sp. MEBiC08052]